MSFMDNPCYICGIPRNDPNECINKTNRESKESWIIAHFSDGTPVEVYEKFEIEICQNLIKFA